MNEVKRYECNGSSSIFEDENGGLVDYGDYAALEAKCAALTAENARLKAEAKETLAHWAAAEPGEMEQMMDKCMPNLRVAYCETPATDAFMAEVRAQGVEMFAQWCRGERDFTLIDDDVADAAAYEECVKRAEYFSAQIRKGGKQK